VPASVSLAAMCIRDKIALTSFFSRRMQLSAKRMNLPLFLL
jgi:hypothetical protein